MNIYMYNTHYISCKTIEEYKNLLEFLFSVGCHWKTWSNIDATLCYFDRAYGIVEKNAFILNITEGTLSVPQGQYFLRGHRVIEAESILGNLKRPSLYKVRER